VAGLELAQQVPSAGPIKVVLLMLPFAVAMVLLSARVWQTAGRPASDGDVPSDRATGPAHASAAVVAVRERADLGAAAYPR
jgi:hypothetical protein